MKANPLAAVLLLPLVCLPQLTPPNGAENRCKGCSVAGVVTDAITGAPIAKARVAVVAGREYNADLAKASTLAATTGIDGSFVIQLDKSGSFWVSVEAEGYMPVESIPHWFTIDDARPTEKVTIDMIRPSGISGRIVDAETKEPVSGIEIRVYEALYYAGESKIGLANTGHALSDSAGNFRISGLTPARYFMCLTSPAATEVAVLGASHVRSHDEPPPAGYGRQWWPGGEIQNALPLLVARGVEMNAGDIPVFREPLFCISGHIAGANCAASQRFRLVLIQEFGRTFLMPARAEVPCGGSFHIENVVPGEYQFASSTGGSEAPSGVIYRELSVRDRDVDVDLSPVPAIVIQGKVVYTDNSSAGSFPMRKRVLRIQPLHGIGLDERPSAPVQDDGSFSLTLYSSRPVQVTFLGLPDSYYISEILYDGHPLKDGILEPNPYAGSQSLKITVSDKAATVWGTVSERDKKIPDATVIVVPWPLHGDEKFPLNFTCATGEDGRFSKTGLPPGSYRVFSVPKPDLDGALQRPDVLAAMAADGKQVDLAPASSNQVTLELRHASQN